MGEGIKWRKRLRGVGLAENQKGVSIMSLEIVILCENTASGGGTLGEHGLSFLIRHGGKKLLFDTGAGMTLLHNAQALDIDLMKTDAVLLSHGHYDHTGGLLDLLKLIGPTDVYGHPHIFSKKYSRRNGEKKYAGIPAGREELEEAGAQFHLQEGPREVFPGLWLTGEVPLETDFEESEENFFLKTEEGFVTDKMLDDQALVIETARGLVVVLGCAHAGAVNTLQRVNNLFTKPPIYAVLGGTHLRSSSRERIEQTVEFFKELKPEHLVINHCSGFTASVAFARAFGSRFAPGPVGYRFTLPD